MQVEERLKALLGANPDTLAAVDMALAGKLPEPERPTLRLLGPSDAAKLTGRSRCSIWRAVKANTLRTVQLRPGGTRLIPEAELRKLIEGKG